MVNNRRVACHSKQLLKPPLPVDGLLKTLGPSPSRLHSNCPSHLFPVTKSKCSKTQECVFLCAHAKSCRPSLFSCWEEPISDSCHPEYEASHSKADGRC